MEENNSIPGMGGNDSQDEENGDDAPPLFSFGRGRGATPLPAYEAEEDGVQDFLPSFANAENRELSKYIKSKEVKLEETDRDLDENSERVRVMSEHFKNVQEEVVFVQSRLDAKEQEIETEAHLKQLAKREVGRLEKDKGKLERAQLELREKMARIQQQVWQGNEKMDQFKLLMNWNQEELEQWALASRQKEEDGLALQKYIREDEGRVSALRLELEKMTKQLHAKEQELEDEVTETRSKQIMLDKTADDFRKLHEERQELLHKFEDATDALHKRDIAIQEASKVFSANQEELREKKTLLDEKSRFLEAEQLNNKELETNIAMQERILTRSRQELAGEGGKVQEMADEVDVLKNTLSKAAADLVGEINTNKSKQVEIIDQRKRLERAEAKMKMTESRMKGADENLGVLELKREDLEAIQKEEEANLLAAEKRIADLKDRMYKANQELFNRRQSERDLIAEIAGTQSQIKNMSLKVSQLDSQVQKQQQLLYTAEFQIQQLERKVARASGERSDEEKRILNKRIEKLTVELEDKTSEHSMLATQVKRATDELRTAQRNNADGNREQAGLTGRIAELQLESDNASRALKNKIKEREDTQVSHDILRLEVKKLRDILASCADEVHGLENKKFQLEMSMEERKHEISVHQEKLKGTVKALSDDIHRCTLELNERQQKVQRLSNKYDVIVGRVRNPEDEDKEKGQTYYMIKAAQEREELQREGDTLDAKIRKAEKEVYALENTLSKVNINNTAYRGSFRPGGSTEALEQRSALRDKLDRAYDRMKLARNEERSLQQDIEHCRSRLGNLEAEFAGAESMSDKVGSQISTLSREIEEQGERLKTAKRQWDRSQKEKREVAGVADGEETLATADALCFGSKEIYREFINELRAIAEEHPELNIFDRAAEAGIKLGPSSRSSSRASSRAPSEAGSEQGGFARRGPSPRPTSSVQFQV